MARAKQDPVVEEARRRVAQLRLQLLSLYPFWGYLLAEVQLLWAPHLPTLAATDGIGRIWLNPKWIALLDRKQLGFVLLHELGHIVLETLGRQEARDRTLWNRATDYAINRQVAEIPQRGGPSGQRAWRIPSVDLPGLGRCEPLLDGQFDHLPAEAIYARLQKNLPVGEGDSAHVELDDGEGHGLRSDPNHGGGVDLHVPAPSDQVKVDQACERLQRAAEAAQRPFPTDNLPLGVDRWLAELQRPRLNWQALLHRYLSEFGAAVERSWARPHRRWLAEGWLVPGAVPERDGTVVLAVDTSGSMDSQRLQAIATELQVLGELVRELWVVSADAAVQDVVPPGQLAEFLKKRRWQGGGGTDHRPLFAWLEQKRLSPDLLICCTDLYTVLPERAPPFPVLWLAMLDGDGGRGPRPGFGAVVEVAAN